MSALNGDRSRFQVRRKAGLLRRQRSRELQATLRLAAPGRAASGDAQALAGGHPRTLRLVGSGVVTE
jgi:hypothetical protein